MCAWGASALRWEKPLLKGAKVQQASLESLGRSWGAEVAEERRVQHMMHGNAACPACLDKTYSELCPDTWVLGEDGLCHAPLSYQGVCAKTQSFVGASRIGKTEVETTCGVCWPCPSRSQCEVDWSQPCPNGFSGIAIPYDEYAEAPGVTCVRQLEGEDCDHEVAFRDVDDKKQFAVRCSVSWPCVENCSGALSVCPVDWEDIGGAICAAPRYFKSSECPLLQNFHGWTSAMKMAHGLKCSVRWGCVGSRPGVAESNGPIVVEQDCEAPDLRPRVCPRQWVRLANAVCGAPSDYGGPCARQVVFEGMSDEEKLMWASKCLVAWPCKGESAIDVDARVPWVASVLSEDGAVSL